MSHEVCLHDDGLLAVGVGVAAAVLPGLVLAPAKKVSSCFMTAGVPLQGAEETEAHLVRWQWQCWCPQGWCRCH